MIPIEDIVETIEADCTYNNLNAEEWANQAEELEKELNLYKYFAKICGIVLLNLFFLTLVGCLPTRKRSLRKSMMTKADDFNNNEDPKTNLKSPENV